MVPAFRIARRTVPDDRHVERRAFAWSERDALLVGKSEGRMIRELRFENAGRRTDAAYRTCESESAQRPLTDDLIFPRERDAAIGRRRGDEVVHERRDHGS